MPRPLVMGVVNVTPDSFSDGGRYVEPRAAVAHGLALVEAGADVLDVGGESTRPGATRPLVAEELARVVPVITELAAAGSLGGSAGRVEARAGGGDGTAKGAAGEETPGGGVRRMG